MSTRRARADRVAVRFEEVELPTYLPAEPDRNPMFLEKRVYQGSSGRVYPLPFTDRIAEVPVDRRWRAVWIENAYLRVMILPELGGRVHVAQDKTNGYDFIYRQDVIKPALVGLAGPWVSGGIEFNWPQHHRPATFLPVEVEVETGPDGSKTVWCGDHDPMQRMKGMHGVCLRPGRALLELRVRVYNRTPQAQSFLWWANAGVRVHEGYQSFFPPDVHYVADHARRATSTYPLCNGVYYGVDYGARQRQGIPAGERPVAYLPPHCAEGAETAGSAARAPRSGVPWYAPNDLSWYANIPTPCSYMCMGSKQDFFGGYDHRAQAGLVHVADHRIAPGKKQWTWGNHAFGYAWDRNLTDADAQGEHAPYIELMAGVFTDNQPDFSFLGPGELRTWAQYWYPVQKIGPATHANLEAAVNLQLGPERFRVGVSVTAPHPGATVRLERSDGSAALEWTADLAPGRPMALDCRQARRPWTVGTAVLRVLDAAGRELIAYAPVERPTAVVPPAACEPPAPARVGSADELYLIGLHLEQYRHATRCPTLYWREALRRDPLDARCNEALGLWHLRRGEWSVAERHFLAAIERLTCCNANPADGGPFYHLGLCLRYQLDGVRVPASGGGAALARRQALAERAEAALAKATWNHAWQGAAHYALAEFCCRRSEWDAALGHLERALRVNTDHLQARNLRALVLRRLRRGAEARACLESIRQRDPLDAWARCLRGDRAGGGLQLALDVALDFAQAGFHAEAVDHLERQLAAKPPGHAHPLPDPSWGALPMVHYTLAWLCDRDGNEVKAARHRLEARGASVDWCFPARLEDIAILEAALEADPADARARYLLGNLLYDRRRHGEAIRQWEAAVRHDPGNAIAWRNLGIGYFNILRQPARARRAYDRAVRANPQDARLLFERDQLWKRSGVAPGRRLRALDREPGLVARRDDLSVERAALLNQCGRPAEALMVLERRRFQPWEGGEGQALGQYVRARLALGQQALAVGRPETAAGHFRAALEVPANLGEGRHLLANASDIHYWLGCALAAGGDRVGARREWTRAARFQGDFQQMRVQTFSELTYHSALAWRRLGCEDRARRLLTNLLAHARALRRQPAVIDYFATSLPTMLLFEDDLQARQENAALFLEAQSQLGLGRHGTARRLLGEVLRRDPSHGPAWDLHAELGSGRAAAR